MLVIHNHRLAVLLPCSGLPVYLTVNCCSQLWRVPFPCFPQQFLIVAPLYGNQLPPFSWFTEESSKTETFSDWLEQLEAVFQLAGWSEHAKLVNLSTHLRGTVYSFYWSCASKKRSNYGIPVEQLSKHFQGAQDFRHTVQSPKESVSDFIYRLELVFCGAYDKEQISTKTKTPCCMYNCKRAWVIYLSEHQQFQVY